eukprot:TRINITY_DN86588_c0_g1_i1.p2 TRINITY_DN86588_c0_g1~~TRINITY_DN86588_c0_g1_i1.p2  ORF type:complete len:122 (-),score=3.39 TRINITY_DN86588_c0_g1_i1:199-564(-)
MDGVTSQAGVEKFTLNARSFCNTVVLSGGETCIRPATESQGKWSEIDCKFLPMGDSNISPISRIWSVLYAQTPCCTAANFNDNRLLLLQQDKSCTIVRHVVELEVVSSSDVKEGHNMSAGM